MCIRPGGSHPPGGGVPGARDLHGPAEGPRLDNVRALVRGRRHRLLVLLVLLMLLLSVDRRAGGGLV